MDYRTTLDVPLVAWKYQATTPSTKPQSHKLQEGSYGAPTPRAHAAPEPTPPPFLTTWWKLHLWVHRQHFLGKRHLMPILLTVLDYTSEYRVKGLMNFVERLAGKYSYLLSRPRAISRTQSAESLALCEEAIFARSRALTRAPLKMAAFHVPPHQPSLRTASEQAVSTHSKIHKASSSPT